MKRSRELEDVDTNLALANYLILLSRGSDNESGSHNSGRVFECKTCNRQFSSFQALGGHRASHKKVKLIDGDAGSSLELSSSPLKPKTHECSICGLEFAIGQALGGHMRRHRAMMNENGSDPDSGRVIKTAVAEQMRQVPVLKKSSSSKRILLDQDMMITRRVITFKGK
ncbi:hypothetical protein RJ641_008653 [Dillenia turbinata]|uniref:C2H2-type domain-containing protein n=1 Tax=Dillenia turbinata TaxID=194707 RepID=A0AAN8V5A3_9MAGN